MLDSTVHASIIAVAGEWAKLIFEITKPRGDLTKTEAISLLRRGFESAYKQLIAAIEILEKEQK